jgi:hypothetical protein
MNSAQEWFTATKEEMDKLVKLTHGIWSISEDCEGHRQPPGAWERSSMLIALQNGFTLEWSRKYMCKRQELIMMWPSA